jgi:hypothetical protein
MVVTNSRLSLVAHTGRQLEKLLTVLKLDSKIHGGSNSPLNFQVGQYNLSTFVFWINSSLY